MYSKIIVPLDGSDLAEQALPYAELVAATLSAPIELVQAYDILPGSVLGSRSPRVADQLQMGARERAEASLSPIRQRLGSRRFRRQHRHPARSCRRRHRRPGRHRPGRPGGHVHPRARRHLPVGHGQHHRQGAAHRAQSHAHRARHGYRPGLPRLVAEDRGGAAGRFGPFPSWRYPTRSAWPPPCRPASPPCR